MAGARSASVKGVVWVALEVRGVGSMGESSVDSGMSGNIWTGSSAGSSSPGVGMGVGEKGGTALAMVGVRGGVRGLASKWFMATVFCWPSSVIIWSERAELP